jgi:hypothetical protein
MKLRITCPNCDEQQEIEMSEDEISGKMFSCGKCRTSADIYNAETGERIASGASYMPGVVIYEENSIVQVIIPVGLCRDDIVKSLKAITEAIESNGAVEGVVLAEVAIAMESDRMIVMKTGLPAADNHEEV